MRTAVLGTGIMGAAMARSLAREGHDVAVWNRTPSRAEAVAGDRITARADLAEAVAGADLVVTMLYDADSVLAIAPDLVAALGPDTVWVQSTTVGPEGMARIAEAAGGAVDRLLDAPVLGTKQPAESGNLTVLVSGPEAARRRAAEVFDAVGARTLEVGDTLGPASALKLVCNSWVASINAATGQAMGFADALGLDPRLFLEAIQGGAADSAYAQVKNGIMAERS
jgi:3-hydroxyisobutyrate dehydrogenase